jgi:hypothetical protein
MTQMDPQKKKFRYRAMSTLIVSFFIVLGVVVLLFGLAIAACGSSK